MTELKGMFVDVYNFFYNIVMSCYNYLNRYIPEPVLLGMGIVLAAFIICVLFKKFTTR